MSFLFFLYFRIWKKNIDGSVKHSIHSILFPLIFHSHQTIKNNIHILKKKKIEILLPFSKPHLTWTWSDPHWRTHIVIVLVKTALWGGSKFRIPISFQESQDRQIDVTLSSK